MAAPITRMMSAYPCLIRVHLRSLRLLDGIGEGFFGAPEFDESRKERKW